jgi:hypothetical protein
MNKMELIADNSPEIRRLVQQQQNDAKADFSSTSRTGPLKKTFKSSITL